VAAACGGAGQCLRRLRGARAACAVSPDACAAPARLDSPVAAGCYRMLPVTTGTAPVRVDFDFITPEPSGFARLRDQAARRLRLGRDRGWGRATGVGIPA